MFILFCLYDSYFLPQNLKLVNKHLNELYISKRGEMITDYDLFEIKYLINKSDCRIYSKIKKI